MSRIISLEIIIVILSMLVLPLVVVILSLFSLASKNNRMLNEFLFNKNTRDINA